MLSDFARDLALNAVTATLVNGEIQLATDATFTSILATFPLGPNPFSPASAGLSASQVLSDVVDTAGTATVFRLRTATGVVVAEETGANAVSGAGGSGLLQLGQATADLAVGQTAQLNSFTLTMAA